MVYYTYTCVSELWIYTGKKKDWNNERGKATRVITCLSTLLYLWTLLACDFSIIHPSKMNGVMCTSPIEIRFQIPTANNFVVYCEIWSRFCCIWGKKRLVWVTTRHGVVPVTELLVSTATIFRTSPIFSRHFSHTTLTCVWNYPSHLYQLIFYC